MNETERTWMLRALELAERGRGHVEPNPLVGAVAVQGGRLVGEGWHEKFGQAHAEVNALAAATGQTQGATLYVTLEPCCHHGKTPPCTDAVIQAGVTRVVAATLDPFGQVSGQGAARLRSAGITVEVGLCEQEARALNAPYLKLLTTGWPYVHAKWAMTLDGKIASSTGDSRWISNESSRQRVHQLRGRMDAIIVGIGTVLADDPLLTARPPGPRTACRVILDSHGRLPLTSQLVRTARQVPTFVVAGAENKPNDEPLRAAGCEVVHLPGEDRPGIVELLTALGSRRFTNVLVEGGSEVLGSFLDIRAIDEVHVFLAPRLAGGRTAFSPIAGAGCAKIADAPCLDDFQWEMCDGDLYLHAKVRAAS
jgi:diaminohydroxyphosphoribosylaminopyrimidine deaminase / 5-amino-6-(5-phosphoribosylamino)uracil reductase